MDGTEPGLETGDIAVTEKQKGGKVRRRRKGGQTGQEMAWVEVLLSSVCAA